LDLFIWDFHGVLEIGNIITVLKVTNQVLKIFGFDIVVDINFIKTQYGKNWKEYYKSLNINLDEYTLNKMFKLSIILGNESAKHNMKPQKYGHQVLKRIYKETHKNCVYSNTSTNTLITFIHHLHYENYISDCIGYDLHNTTEISKKQMIGILKSKYDYDKIVVIGDTDEDMMSGKIHGATTYLFLCPSIYNKYEFINITNNYADYKINDLREILREL